MTRALVVYATREGHTRKVADYVGARLRTRGLEVDVVDAGQAPPSLDLGAYAHVVLAASVHIGKHEREMIRFVRAHKEALDRTPTSFLSVSMAEAGVEDPSRTPDQRARAASDVKHVIDRFLAETGLHPARVMPVAGALMYVEYGWLVRMITRGYAKREGGPTDTSRNHELTDWVSLDRFADEVVATLGPAAEHAARA